MFEPHDLVVPVAPHPRPSPLTVRAPVYHLHPSNGDNMERNVTYKVAGNKLYITVDLTQDLGPSSTGKTIIIGSSGGNVALAEAPGVSFGLNVFKKASA